MRPWIKILALALAAATILLLVSVLVFWCRRRRRLVSKTSPQFLETGTKSKNESLQAALAKLHISYKSRSTSKAGLRFQNLHHHHHNDHHPVVAGQQPPFKWDDHQRLITEALENGWSRFAFTSRPSLPSARPTPSPLWGLCAVCDAGTQAETDWEVPLGSSEFMQTVRLNPSGDDDDDPAVWRSVRMALPLPGPPLGGSSFPQEAYFEITILYLQPHRQQQEGDRVKLIEENSNEGQSDALIHAMDKAARGNSRIQEPGTVIKEGIRGRDDRGPLLSLGLTIGGPPPTRSSPGTYSGSIGFHSNGSVYLDGMKLVLESEKTEWTEVNKVVGCGFDPGKKKVFFTVDSQLIHVIYCHSEGYRSPLYPVLAASVDVMVLVNLGQSKFKYAPANAHRTRNPCFIRSASADGGTAVVSYEDSRELFSMGRIDSDWLDAAKQSNSGKKGNDGGGVAMDVDAESDLFEIALHS